MTPRQRSQLSVNEKARLAAAEAGKPTFRLEVVEHWPACTECGVTIRIRGIAGPRGRPYTCGCQGVAWTPTGPIGWERSEV